MLAGYRTVVVRPSRVWIVPGSIPGLAVLFSSYAAKLKMLPRLKRSSQTETNGKLGNRSEKLGNKS
jgi:hypothetical protein